MQQENLQLKSNIYANKVNNPTFIPSSGLLEENSKSAIKISDKAIKKSKAKKDASGVRLNYKIEAKYEEEEQSLSQKNIKIKLPNIFRDTPESDYFLKDMISSQEANRYGEDYCSTFYKRNIHGYMFIKEPSNSLKVNASGGKSSVSLKISLPAGNNRLLAKKLKVDVKELPIWKPISSGNGGTASFTARRRPNVNSNNTSNGTKETKGIQATQDPPKLKNGNLSKRFGRRNTPKQTP
ncbi:uncharacterized protein SPAPADRAFT_60843 [Spathaspora passalidarum NRRL Y-27907]|uniref:Uncharacterized protein n=1 Tax=Spathaspora passalidarum (strain NRRL Y-27907 / 11-Y1) TaxID=619300 RepID=G3AMP7_SPAPN|nr:uncharacterized protein SPAPADRAFT_60843 [Spathaspora passalidarum NRRL Y-27907]EGW33491.1 hypothetical protein SPAPADRAFT_60843 [Spathaspora passalidarum NRRL Y-27907]